MSHLCQTDQNWDVRAQLFQLGPELPGGPEVSYCWLAGPPNWLAPGIPLLASSQISHLPPWPSYLPAPRIIQLQPLRISQLTALRISQHQASQASYRPAGIPTSPATRYAARGTPS